MKTTRVWWIYTVDDTEQHATLHCPPRGGGTLPALCSSEIVAPPAIEIQLRPHRPHCQSCVLLYCATDHPIPLWTY